MLRPVCQTLALLFLAPAALPAQTALPRKHTPQPTTAAITPADLMTRLYIFSDDSMMGRETATLGNVKGTAYLAAEAARIGLEPAGDSGTYFQNLPFKTRAFDTTSSVVVNGTPLKFGDEYVAFGSEDLDLDNVPVIFGGALGDTAHALAPGQADGKLVVFTSSPTGRRFFRAPPVPGAAAVAMVALAQLPPGYRQFFDQPRPFLDDPSAPQRGGGRPTVLLSDEAASKLLGGSPDQLPVGAPGRTVSVHIHYDVQPLEYPTRNVVAILPGSDPKLKGEYVALGAHNDHLGIRQPVDHDSIRIWNHIVRPEGADDGGKNASGEQQTEVDSLLAAYRAAHPGQDRIDSIANGADDDGSGSVAVLEIAQKLAAMNPHPKRSILFVWHVGEEEGLYGSRYFTDHPTVPRDSIVTQLNMDMVGRGDASDETGRTKDGTPIHGNPNYLQLVGSRRLSTELGDLIEQVNKEDHHHIDIDYSIDANGHPSRIYCRSDHYSYARYGIPIAFFTTGLHSDYHQVTDEPQYIDYEHMARVVNFVADIAVHVANLDHRPVVDHPKPDPHGSCVQ